MLSDLFFRVRTLFRHKAAEAELDEEMRFHIQQESEKLAKSGLSRDEALRRARIEFGGLDRVKEECREARGTHLIETVFQDLRFGTRMLRKSSGFAAIAVLTLALGIGANTAVFSVVNAVLLKPLAYRNADRIVTLTNPLTTGGVSNPLAVRLVAIPNFQDWHNQSSSFEAMGFYYSWEAPTMQGANAEYARITKISPEFFRVFAVEPLIGRFFTTEEMKPGSDGALLISYAYWQSHFGGDTKVLGRTIRTYNTVRPIVGVLPLGFGFPDKTDLWFPDTDDSPVFHSRDAQNHYVIGRLSPGVPVARAQTEMTTIARRLDKQYPQTNKNLTVVVTGMQDEMVGDVRLTLYLLLGAVSVVLLIACANTATLLLGKATARTREVAVRAALGASRRRIVRQLVTESFLLALLAGGVGLLLAYWGSKSLIALAPADLPRLDETGINRGVLAFTLGVSVLTSFLFGLVPALYASRIDLNNALKQAGTRFTIGGGMVRTRGVLVVTEIALAVALLAGAGLLIKSFIALQNVVLGFRPENVLVMRATGPGSIRDTNLFFKDVLSQIAVLPGVTAAGATMALPGHLYSTGHYYFDHLPERQDTTAPIAAHSIVAPGTFAALGIPLKSGRDFNDGDVRNRPFVAVINEAMARKSLPGEDPLGRTIFCPFDSDKGMTIIGVVGDVREGGPAHEPIPECYMAYQQHVYNNLSLSIVTRTLGDPTALEETERRLARLRSPDVPVTFTTLEDDASGNVAAPRFRTLLFGVFAGLAVCLAMAGVYGVMAYVAGQRSSEIGLRMAVGASTGSVLRLLLGQGLGYASLGLALGLAASLAGTRLLRTMLFQVQPNDPATFAAVSGVLLGVALVACYIPARRAAKVDPMIALRLE